MIIRNVTIQQLFDALNHANAQYANNLRFKNREILTQSGLTHRVTLTVKDSSQPGARRSINRYRADGEPTRIAAACWHAHRDFLDALPQSAIVRSSTRMTNPNGTSTANVWSPGQPHADWNIGSFYEPCMASEACPCDG